MAPAPALAHPTVAIVGGGWAGLACALQLAQAGYRPVVFESAPEAGGRARSALIEGLYRDNGQHLMLAGCKSLTTLFKLAGIQVQTVPFIMQSGARRLRVPAHSGRLGLATALWRAQGFSWNERYRLIAAIVNLQLKGWQVPEGQSVAEWLLATHQPPALIREFWAPLALAVLNTPLADAAMRRFASVLRDSLGSGGRALAMLLPAGNLSEQIVTPLVHAIEKLGGAVRCAQRVLAIQQTTHGFELRVQGSEQPHHFDQIVLALPPWALDKMTLPACINQKALAEAFGTQPIATVYLGFEAKFRLPVPLLQIAGPTANDSRIWATDRAYCGEPGVIALSVSAAGPWCQLSHDDLAAACLNALQEVIEPLPRCLWKKTVVVRRATYAATPGATLQATDLNPLPHLYLAGDWTDATYPATLEAAVQSGFKAAAQIMKEQG